jgi:anti-sigma factor RsiW
MSACRSIAPLLETFRDGELGPERVIEVEQHLTECSRCVERVRFSEAIRSSLRHQSRSSAQVSSAFQTRVASALEAARKREWEQASEASGSNRGRLFGSRNFGTMAVAAAVTLAWVANRTQTETPSAGRNAASYASVDPRGIDSLLEELVEHHVTGRPEFTELALLPEAEREVGVPLHIPSFKQYGGRWEGASVVPVNRNQRAASLRYTLGNHRMTLYVYDSSRFPVEKQLEQRQVGAESVYVGVRRGYSIGATEHRGVGYALASDLSDTETAELVAGLN